MTLNKECLDDYNSSSEEEFTRVMSDNEDPTPEEEEEMNSEFCAVLSISGFGKKSPTYEDDEEYQKRLLLLAECDYGDAPSVFNYIPLNVAQYTPFEESTDGDGEITNRGYLDNDLLKIEQTLIHYTIMKGSNRFRLELDLELLKIEQAIKAYATAGTALESQTTLDTRLAELALTIKEYNLENGTSSMEKLKKKKLDIIEIKIDLVLQMFNATIHNCFLNSGGLPELVNIDISNQDNDPLETARCSSPSTKVDEDILDQNRANELSSSKSLSPINLARNISNNVESSNNSMNVKHTPLKNKHKKIINWRKFTREMWEATGARPKKSDEITKKNKKSKDIVTKEKSLNDSFLIDFSHNIDLETYKCDPMFLPECKNVVPAYMMDRNIFCSDNLEINKCQNFTNDSLENSRNTDIEYEPDKVDDTDFIGEHSFEVQELEYKSDISEIYDQVKSRGVFYCNDDLHSSNQSAETFAINTSRKAVNSSMQQSSKFPKYNQKHYITPRAELGNSKRNASINTAGTFDTATGRTINVRKMFDTFNGTEAINKYAVNEESQLVKTNGQPAESNNKLITQYDKKLTDNKKMDICKPEIAKSQICFLGSYKTLEPTYVTNNWKRIIEYTERYSCLPMKSSARFEYNIEIEYDTLIHNKTRDVIFFSECAVVNTSSDLDKLIVDEKSLDQNDKYVQLPSIFKAKRVVPQITPKRRYKSIDEVENVFNTYNQKLNKQQCNMFTNKQFPKIDEALVEETSYAKSRNILLLEQYSNNSKYNIDNEYSDSQNSKLSENTSYECKPTPKLPLGKLSSHLPSVLHESESATVSKYDKLTTKTQLQAYSGQKTKSDKEERCKSPKIDSLVSKFASILKMQRSSQWQPDKIKQLCSPEEISQLNSQLSLILNKCFSTAPSDDIQKDREDE